MKKYRLLIALFVLLTASCQQDALVEEYYELSAEFLSYCYFEPGSYWVYQKNNENVFDTIVVDSIISYTGVNGLTEESDNRFIYDAIEELVQIPNKQNIRKWEIAASLKTNVSGNEVSNELLRIYFNDRYNIALYPNTPQGEKIDFGSKEGYYETMAHFSQFSIPGNTFYEVYHTRVYDSLHPGGIRITDFYIARNHGIITYTYQTPVDTVTWKLVDWDLTQ
ncbi:MAG: hypothetical protein U5Q03_02465 [Bacteroidota bacterium]|nr:hypothetical protein [Bacteroidota bacterium]